MYPAKILLFGEYTILIGSQGLSIPYNHFNGHLTFVNGADRFVRTDIENSNKQLFSLYKHIKSLNINDKLIHKLDLDQFKNDLEDGLYFNSTIPEKYGLGSSGALIAAVYHRFNTDLKNKSNLIELRKDLAQLESFYHGSSSGIDPLVSYTGTPLYIGDKGIEVLDLSVSNYLKNNSLFLLKTSLKSTTIGPVDHFLYRLESDQQFSTIIRKQYIPVINSCIQAVKENSSNDVFISTIKQLSEYQSKWLVEMIPEPLAIHFNHGIEQDKFYLKLCGSGGGGYFLGFTKDISEVKNYFESTSFEIILI